MLSKYDLLYPRTLRYSPQRNRELLRTFVQNQAKHGSACTALNSAHAHSARCAACRIVKALHETVRLRFFLCFLHRCIPFCAAAYLHNEFLSCASKRKSNCGIALIFHELASLANAHSALCPLVAYFSENCIPGTVLLSFILLTLECMRALLCFPQVLHLQRD